MNKNKLSENDVQKKNMLLKENHNQENKNRASKQLPNLNEKKIKKPIQNIANQENLQQIQNSDESIQKNSSENSKQSQIDKDIQRQVNKSEVLHKKYKNLNNIHYDNKSFCRQASPINAKFLENIQTAVQMTEKRLGKKIEFNFDNEHIQEEIINESKYEEEEEDQLSIQQKNNYQQKSSEKKKYQLKKNLIPKSIKANNSDHNIQGKDNDINEQIHSNNNDNYFSLKSQEIANQKKYQIENNSQQYRKQNSLKIYDTSDNKSFHENNINKIINNRESDNYKNQLKQAEIQKTIQNQSQDFDQSQKSKAQLKLPNINNNTQKNENKQVEQQNQQNQVWKQAQIGELPKIMEGVNKNINQCQDAANQRMKNQNNKMSSEIQNKVIQEFDNMDMKLTIFDQNQLQLQLNLKKPISQLQGNFKNDNKQQQKNLVENNDSQDQYEQNLTQQNQTIHENSKNKIQTMSEKDSTQQSKKQTNSSIYINNKPPHPQSKNSVIQKNKNINISKINQKTKEKQAFKKKRSPSARSYQKTKSNNSIHSSNSQKNRNGNFMPKLDKNQDQKHEKKRNSHNQQQQINSNQNKQQQQLNKNKARNLSAHAPSYYQNKQQMEQITNTQKQNTKTSCESSINLNKKPIVNNLFEINQESSLGSSLFTRHQQKMNFNQTNQFNFDSDLDELMQIEFKNYDARSNLLDIQKQMLEYKVMNDVQKMKMIINQQDLQKA